MVVPWRGVHGARLGIREESRQAWQLQIHHYEPLTWCFENPMGKFQVVFHTKLQRLHRFVTALLPNFLALKGLECLHLHRSDSLQHFAQLTKD